MLFDIDTARNFVLIIHELFCNCVKYAYPNSKKGVVRVLWKKQKKDMYQLEISDKGVGISSNINLKQPSTFGLSLIKRLTHQMAIDYHITSKNGTHYLFSIPKCFIKHA